MAGSFESDDDTYSPPAAPSLPRTKDQRRKRKRTSPQRSDSITGSDTALSYPLLPSAPNRRPRHINTLYDSVAGRLTGYSYPKDPSYKQSADSHDNILHTSAPLGPKEALSTRHRAPKFAKEESLYSMHGRLPQRTLNVAPVAEESQLRFKMDPLPSSDLIKAVHTYSSDFFDVTTADRGRCDWRSLDETALLAVGILMEEEVCRLLGANGWAVFVEADTNLADDISIEIDSDRQSERTTGEVDT